MVFTTYTRTQRFLPFMIELLRILDHVDLSHMLFPKFLFGTLVILLNSETDNQILKGHLLTLVLQVVLEVLPRGRKLLASRSHLE